MKHGQGPMTTWKERSFASALKINLTIASKRSLLPWEYVHVDLHAGSGWNETIGCDGSPVVFRKLAELQRPKFRAFFCDHDVTQIIKLRAAFALTQSDQRYGIFHEDNATTLNRVRNYLHRTQRRPEFAIGTVIVDPNGYFHDKTVPTALLQDFAEEFPRMDLLFNLNLTTYHLGLGHDWHKSMFFPKPSEIAKLFHRKHGVVQIRQPIRGHKFLTLMLRSMQTGDHRSLGLYDMEGSIGRSMLETLRSNGQAPLEF